MATVLPLPGQQAEGARLKGILANLLSLPARAPLSLHSRGCRASFTHAEGDELLANPPRFPTEKGFAKSAEEEGLSPGWRLREGALTGPGNVHRCLSAFPGPSQAPPQGRRQRVRSEEGY